MRSRFSILLGNAAGLLALTVVAFCCRYAAPEPTVFKNVKEVKDFAVSKGLVFHCGNGNGIVCSNFFLADHPLTIDDLDGVCSRHDCGLTPAWRGVLWVCQLGGIAELYPECLGGTWRIWGSVLVAGDEKLMDRIEGLYRNK
jgi:hypothetical protein